MTVRNWTGASDASAFLTVGNWTGGGSLTDGDTLVIASTSHDIRNSGGGDTSLDSIILRFGDGFTGTFGTAAEPIWLGSTTAGSIDFDSAGSAHYFKGKYGTVTVTGGVQGANTMDFEGSTNTDIATLNVFGGAGTITANTNVDLVTLVVSGAPAATVTVASSVTSLATMEIDSGQVTTSSDCTTVNARGGTLTLSGATAVTTLQTYNNGTVLYNSSGKLTTLKTWGSSRVDATGNANATVTAPTTMQANGSSVVDLRNGLGTFTGWSWLSGGGIVYPPVGSTVTIS